MTEQDIIEGYKDEIQVLEERINSYADDIRVLEREIEEYERIHAKLKTELTNLLGYLK